MKGRNWKVNKCSMYGPKNAHDKCKMSMVLEFKQHLNEFKLILISLCVKNIRMALELW